MNSDLTAAQHDYAIYLPAISNFYATYIGKQQHEEYVEASRMPQGIPEMEMLNFFNPNKGLFHYQWGLYSAGHANLDLNKDVPAEYMIRKRGKHTTLLADSGGFQIAKGVWAADWKDPNDKQAEKYRSTVLKWLCGVSDYSMTLDIPTWTTSNPEWSEKNGIWTYEDAITATRYNHEYFMKHSTGETKFLNVLQGSNHEDADDWYDRMKQYSDPKQYEKFFQGWAMGGANMADPHLALKRIVTLIHDGLLEEGKHDWMHFLGTSKMEWAVILTDIQRNVRKYHNPRFTISFDSASPFLATANGQIYTHTTSENDSRWTYKMEPTADNKAYASDTRSFRDAVLQDGIHDIFDDSPISANLMVKDICKYAPGELNKIGKEGKTSWDSFSYTLMMGHNVWHHINAVQQANRVADSNMWPNTLKMKLGEHGLNGGTTSRNIIDEVFAEPDYDNRLAILEKYSSFWTGVSGARGMGGKKAVSGARYANKHLDGIDKLPAKPNAADVVEREQLSHTAQLKALFSFGDSNDLDEGKLDNLEESV